MGWDLVLPAAGLESAFHRISGRIAAAETVSKNPYPRHDRAFQWSSISGRDCSRFSAACVPKMYLDASIAHDTVSDLSHNSLKLNGAG